MDKDLVPRISVILPAYNAEAYIRESIESILAQTFTDFEFLIINNASTDRTVEIIESYKDPRIKLITNPTNLGLIGSLNVGLKAARGKYIARMDHDDRAEPTRFEKEYTYLESHPDIAIVGTWSNIMDSNGKFIRIHKNPLLNNVIKYELMFGNNLTHPSIMMRREIILKEGGYDPEWVNTEDYNLYSRIIRKYPLANIPEPLLNYRVHGASLTGESASQAIMHKNTKRMIRNNVGYYLPISDEEENLITQVLIARLPNPTLKLRDVLKANKLYKRIHHSFLSKEQSNLSREEYKEIESRFKARRDLMFKKYLVGKYHLITGKHA
jgi:glycosyltransferase involved in cell wall biosynthesis